MAQKVLGWAMLIIPLLLFLGWQVAEDPMAHIRRWTDIGMLCLVWATYALAVLAGCAYAVKQKWGDMLASCFVIFATALVLTARLESSWPFAALGVVWTLAALSLIGALTWDVPPAPGAPPEDDELKNSQ